MVVPLTQTQNMGTDYYDKFLKEWYLSSWIDQLNSMTTTWKLFRRRKVTFAGRQMVIPIRYGRNGGVGAIPLTSQATTNVPTNVVPGYQGVENSTVKPKIIQGALQISQDVIDSSKTDRGAFYEVVDFEMRGLVQDLAEDMDRQVYGEGNGTLATVDDAVIPAGEFDVDNHFPFYAGMVLDSWTSGGGGAAGGSGMVVGDVTRNSDGSGTVVLDTSLGNDTTGMADNDVVARADVRTTAAGYEFMGIKGIVNTANPGLESDFQGLDRSSVGSWWDGYVDSTAAAITETKIQTAFDNTHDTSNGDVNVLLMHRKVRRTLYNALASSNQTRFVDTNAVQPGFLAGKVEDHHPDSHDFLFWDGRVPIVVDKYAPFSADSGTPVGSIFGLDLSSIYVALVTDFKWWAPQGYILRPSQDRAFAVEGLVYLMGNLVCDAPSKNFHISQITGI